MNLTQKIATAAGALTLGATGIAAAGATPDAADAGLTKASAQVGVELPASRTSHPGVDEHADDAAEEVDRGSTEAEEADETGSDHEGTGPVDNHGAEVSPVAQSDATTGRDHGMAVSEVARQGHGQGPSDDHPAARP